MNRWKKELEKFALKVRLTSDIMKKKLWPLNLRFKNLIRLILILLEKISKLLNFGLHKGLLKM